MIYGHIDSKDGYSFLLKKPAWRLAFDWLREVSCATPAGIHKLQGDEIYVNVHGYDTLPLAQCRYESHRRYVDLQYCIDGGERIDWQRVSDLEPDSAFEEERDVQFYRPAPIKCTMEMVPGAFGIFFPSDGHAPKRQNGRDFSVFKLVIKVDRRLVE
jgi:biofilm protein TabA